jgi:hypothetical protein
LLPRLLPSREDRRLVTRHVPKSLFILTRSAPKRIRYVCASSIKMPLLPLPNCQRTNRKTNIPKQCFGGHFAVTTTDGLKQARRLSFGAGSSTGSLRNCFKPSRGDRRHAVVTIRFSPVELGQCSESHEIRKTYRIRIVCSANPIVKDQSAKNDEILKQP